MGRALLVLETAADRGKAVHWITKAPVGTRVEFKASKRSLPQNDLMWALLTDFSQQFAHNGKKYDPSEWKCIFLHAFGREISFLPSLDGRTFLPIEMSSSDLSKQEMTDFIEFILKEAAERGVILHIPKETTEPGSSPHHEPDATESPSSVAEGVDMPPSTPSSIPDATEQPVADLVSGEDPAGGEIAPSQPPAGSTLSSDQRAKLIEAAGKFMKLAQEQISFESRLQFLESREADWRDVIEPANWPKLESLATAARAVINSKRTPVQAFSFMAEVLGCSVADIGGAP